MHDRILGIVRETLLHENTFESLSVALGRGEVLLALLQPNEASSWPDHRLRLTFSGVRELKVVSIGEEIREGELILDIQCTAVDRGYRIEFTVGDPGLASCVLSLLFADLRFKRT